MAKKSNGSAGFSVNFKFEKETPGTFRYAEEGDPDQHKMGSVYIKKGAFKDAPKAITVTVAGK